MPVSSILPGILKHFESVQFSDFLNYRRINKMSGQGSREKEKEKGATNGEVTPVGNSSQHNTDYDYLIKFLALGIIFRAH